MKELRKAPSKTTLWSSNEVQMFFSRHWDPQWGLLGCLQADGDSGSLGQKRDLEKTKEDYRTVGKHIGTISKADETETDWNESGLIKCMLFMCVTGNRGLWKFCDFRHHLCCLFQLTFNNKDILKVSLSIAFCLQAISWLVTHQC